MVVCDLDSDAAGELLGWKLKSWQALLLHRALPSCGGFIVYLAVMCYDFALVYEHFQNGDDGIGAFCCILIITPALLNLVFALVSPPPDLLKIYSSTQSIDIQRRECTWIGVQLLNCLFFPVATIGRYIHQIFWWVEVVCAVRYDDKERAQEALSRARTPSSMELYLFLQAFIHCAPHAIVNILDLMARFDDPAFGKVSVQAVSIVLSTLRMASTATVYRRFEREKLCGRKYPWVFKLDAQKPNIEDIQNNEEEPIYEAIPPKEPKETVNTQAVKRHNVHSDFIEFSPTEEASSPWNQENWETDSGTSSDFIPTDERKNSKLDSDSEEEYLRPISIIDKVAPRRRDTAYTIEKVAIHPPPLMPAPRPGSLAVWAEKMMESAEAFPTWISAPPRYKYTQEVIKEEPEIPQRVPRAFLRALEPPDMAASIMQYLGWYSFFVSRLVSIAAFINCLPVIAIVILGCQYQVTLLLLIVPEAPTVKRAFYFFLALIYLFCLMEFKIRFRHVRVWHAVWMSVCTVETVLFIGLWYSYGNQLGDYWRSYVLHVVLLGMLLSYMCFLVHFVLLKPKETIVYINNKSSVPKQ